MSLLSKYNLRPVPNPHLGILQYDFTIQCGSDLTVPLYMLDGEDKPLDLTRCTAFCELRKEVNSQDPFDSLTTENGRIDIDVDESTIYLHFPREVTKEYDVDTLNESYLSNLGNSYLYDVFLKTSVADGEGEERCIIKGCIKIYPQISR